MKTSKFLAFSLAALAFGACSNDNDADNGGSNKQQTQNAATIEISVKNATVPRSTTETGTAAERNISVLEFYVFNADGSTDGTTSYLQKTYASGASVGTTRLQISANSDGTATSKTIAIVANSNIGSVADYATLKAKLGTSVFTAEMTTLNHNARTVPSNGFEMSGESTFSAQIGTTSSVTVGISRLVSKFNMPLFETTATDFKAMPEADLEALFGEATTNAEVDFTFNGYALVNGISKSDLYVATTWDQATKTPYLNSEFETSGEYKNNYSGLQTVGGTADWFLSASATEEPVYVFENIPGTITVDGASGFNPKQTYAFIVKGTLAKGSVEKIRYWRVNLIKDSEYSIIRNAVYKLTVNSIKSIGYNTPKEAEESDPIIPLNDEAYVDVTVVVNNWEVISSSTEM